jgi:uncharacterized repeat protein (TIGR03803 family)
MLKAMGSMAPAWSAVLLAAAMHVAPAQESVIYSFQPGSSDGQSPNGGVAIDKGGNVYGTTATGGTHGSGIVYELSPPSQSGGDWTETVVYNFGDNPAAGGSPGITGQGGTVILDTEGNLYGTANGGVSNVSGVLASGVVYELSPPTDGSGEWTAQALYTFLNDSSEPTSLKGPNGAVVLDKKGNLYGIGYGGGAYGNGGVFELSPPMQAGGEWTMTPLYSFNNAAAANQPWGPGANASLIVDAKGNLYGTTQSGGIENSGTVYELSPPPNGSGSWTASILHSFKFEIPHDGYGPLGSLAMDTQGNLYGTTGAQGALAGGIVFELSPPASPGGEWIENILENFTAFSTTGGSSPFANLVLDKQGNLWGTTYYGGPDYTEDSTNSDGVIFELILQADGEWTQASPVPYFFGSQDDDAYHPNMPIVIDTKGNIYSAGTGGANTCNGTARCGAVWEYTPPAPVITLTFAPRPAVYALAQTVSISDSLPGSAIYYTTNGKTPTTASTLYKDPIDVTRNTTIKAIAVHDTDTSAVATAVYVILAERPTITPVSGAYSDAQWVEIRDTTPGAAIHYTTNGTVPTAASPIYSKRFEVAVNETVSAIAIATEYGNSPVAKAKITIETAMPVISPNGGAVAKGAKVSITDATTGAAIYYTTNGTLPTTGSKRYTGALSVESPETVKAIAVAAKHVASSVATTKFTIR